MSTHSGSAPFKSQTGASMVEVAVSMGVLIVVLLSTGFGLMRSYAFRTESFDAYRAMVLTRDMIADAQERANLPQDLVNDEGIGAMYAYYNLREFPLIEMPGTTVRVSVFADEAGVPAELGGPQDLNYDGDSQDDLSNASNGTDLKTVPMRFELLTSASAPAVSMTIYRLVTTTIVGE